MSFCKTEGIVIRSSKHNDDIFITLLSEHSGRRDFVLKGIVKSKRRPVAAGEAGSFISIDFYDKETDVSSVKEVSLLNRFDRLKSGYGGYLVVLYITEMVNLLIPPGVEGGKIYLLMKKFLEELDRGNYHAVILPSFKIKLLYYLGMIPREFMCSSCGIPVQKMEQAEINTSSFEIYCSNCIKGKSHDRDVILFLHKLLHETYANMFATEADLEIIKKSDVLLNSYLAFYLGRKLKSAKEFYQHLGNEYELYH